MMKRIPAYSCAFLIVTLFIFSLPAVAEENRGEVAVTSEVEKLIEFLRMSGCTFYRNGSWFEADKAANHINKKYRYVQKKGLVRTTEDFILYAATKSSMSGKPYLVKCGDAEAQKCAEWLGTELIELRGRKSKQ